MKKFLLFALSAVSFGAIAQTNYPGGISGCIGRWDFAQSGGTVTALTDVSGNGNHSSSVNNLTLTTGFRGVANKAMSFNGLNSAATIPHASMLQPTQITMVGMVRISGFYNGLCQNNYILGKGHDKLSGHYNMSIGDNIYDNSCYINSPNNKQLGAQFGPPPGYAPPAGNYVTTGQWYFFAVSTDGTTQKYYQVAMDPNNYISGITPIWNATGPNSMGSSTQNVYIGKHDDVQYPYWFNGTMEEVVIFNRMLSNTEIQQVYDYLWGIVAVTSVPTNLCTGQPFNVSYSVNNTSFFSSTNTFTVQLSNASGSFVSPTNIGSAATTAGGTISCTIPTSIPDGSGYRIRIVASNVAYTSNNNGTNLTVTNITNPSITSNTPVCAGQTLNLSGSSSTTGVTYNWSGPFGFSSTQQNPSIPNVTTASSGAYTLYTTRNGCTSLIDTEMVVVGSNVPPTVTSYASPGDTVCVGGTAAFYALVTGGASPQYQWMKNGNPVAGETSATFVTTTLATGDVVHCRVTSNGCGSAIVTNSNAHTIFLTGKTPTGVSINASPGLQVSPWTLVTFTASVSNGGLMPTYQWKLNGNDILGATGQTWSANNLVNNDAVSVVVKSSSDCAEPAIASSQALVVLINTSVKDIDNSSDLRIYPNPNSGLFVVESKNGEAIEQVEIVNIVGQALFSEQYNNHVQSIRVQADHLPAGVYLVKVKAGETTFQSRLVIQK